MKHMTDAECLWQIQVICHRANLTEDLIWTNHLRNNFLAPGVSRMMFIVLNRSEAPIL